MVKINESNHVRGNWIGQGKLPNFLHSSIGDAKVTGLNHEPPWIYEGEKSD